VKDLGGGRGRSQGQMSCRKPGGIRRGGLERGEFLGGGGGDQVNEENDVKSRHDAPLSKGEKGAEGGGWDGAYCVTKRTKKSGISGKKKKRD